MKQIRVMMKLKNNFLISARERLGLSQTAMAKRLKINNTHYGRIENLHYYPFSKRTLEWLPVATRIAKLLKLPEEMIFSDALKEIKKTKTEFNVDVNELKVLSEGPPNPEELFLKQEQSGAIRKGLSLLTPRQEKVLRMRFGFEGDPMTLDEVGDAMGVQRERIRQIEAKAIRRLRHHRMRKLLKCDIKIPLHESSEENKIAEKGLDTVSPDKRRYGLNL